MATRDEILAVNDRVVKAVDIPEWGMTIHMRTLSGAECQPLFDLIRASGEVVSITAMAARMAVLSICECDGSAVFSLADEPALMAKSHAALRRIHRAFDELNPISVEAEKAIEKNSPATGDGSSG